MSFTILKSSRPSCIVLVGASNLMSFARYEGFSLIVHWRTPDLLLMRRRSEPSAALINGTLAFAQLTPLLGSTHAPASSR